MTDDAETLFIEPPVPEQAEPPPVTDVARRLEAILLIVDEPQSLVSLAAAVAAPVARRAPGDRGSRRWTTTARPAVRAAGSSCARSAADGGCTCARSTTSSSRSSSNSQAPSRLSQAALETLAVIAYKQPVTRGQVASIRAVNVDSVVRTLLSRGPDHRALHGCRDRRHPLRHDRRAAGESRHQLARRAAAHLAAAR